MTESKNRRFMVTAMAATLIGAAAHASAEESYTFRPLDAQPLPQYPAQRPMPMQMPPGGPQPPVPMMQQGPGPMPYGGPMGQGPYGAPPMGGMPYGPSGPVPMAGPSGPMPPAYPGQMPMAPAGPVGQAAPAPMPPRAPARPGPVTQGPASAPGAMPAPPARRAAPPPRYGSAPYQRRSGPTWGGSRNPFDNGPWGNKNQSWRPESWFSDRRPIFGRKGPSEWFDRDDYKDGLGDMWDDLLNAPANAGKMPGSWYAPTISVPNPSGLAPGLE